MSEPIVFKQPEWKARTEELFGQYETAYIIGKGPTFRDPRPRDGKSFVLGINHAVNHIQHPTAVLIQDWCIWAGINAYHKMNHCIMPLRSLDKGDFVDKKPSELRQIVKRGGFTGSILPYSDLSSEGYKHYDSKLGKDKLFLKFATSGYQGCAFVRSFLPNVKRVVTFGMANEPKLDKLYHNHFNMNTSVIPKYTMKGFYYISRLLIEDMFKDTDIELEVL